MRLQVNGDNNNGAGPLPGDGIAFWYTDTFNEIGPILGGPAKFAGLGIFISTPLDYNTTKVAQIEYSTAYYYYYY